jgi:hypothetical protein
MVFILKSVSGFCKANANSYTMNLAPFGRTCSRIHLNSVHPVNPVNPVKKIRQDNRIKQDTSLVNPWFQYRKMQIPILLNLAPFGRVFETTKHEGHEVCRVGWGTESNTESPMALYAYT